MGLIEQTKDVYQLLVEKRPLNREQKGNLAMILGLLGFLLGLFGAGIDVYLDFRSVGTVFFFVGCTLVTVGMFVILGLVFGGKSN